MSEESQSNPPPIPVHEWETGWSSKFEFTPVVDNVHIHLGNDATRATVETVEYRDGRVRGTGRIGNGTITFTYDAAFDPGTKRP